MTDKELRELFPDYEMLEPMTKEQLMDLKKKINELSDEDKKQRDLYLRGLATGEIQGPPVGFASIDKPWLKYYSEEQIIEEAPKTTCYENLFNNNIEHLSDVAIDYFGNKITYKKLFENKEFYDAIMNSLGNVIYRLMKNEQRVSSEEVKRIIEDCAVEVCKFLCCSHLFNNYT